MFAFQLIKNADGNHDIENINNAIEEYNLASLQGRAEPVLLEPIISAIDTYIQKIPLTLRNKSLFDKDVTWQEQLKDYPQAVDILNIQKKAVALLFLPEGKTEAKARWSLIKNLMSPKTKGKLMDSAYWPESRFQGNTFIYEWINEVSFDAKHNFRSYQELTHYNHNLSGISAVYTTYLKNPENYKLKVKDKKFYFSSQPIDSTNSSGAHVKGGEVIFVVGKDGSIYTSDPRAHLGSSFHHSSFLQGKSVLCAGTLKFKEGTLTEITTLSGHYKPTIKNLLHFLAILKDEYHLDLSKIRVKTYHGGFRNAEKFYKMQGMCLPDNKADFMLEQAMDAIREGNKSELHYFLDKAIELGSEEALFSKAKFMAKEEMGYEGKKEKGIELLEDIMKASKFRLYARQIMFEVAPERLKVFDSHQTSQSENKTSSTSQKSEDVTILDTAKQLQTIIETAFAEYYNWIKEKSGGSMSVGFFHRHGKDGIAKAALLVEDSRNVSFSKIVYRIQDFYSDNYTDESGTKFKNKARANNHSFISFLLNEMKGKPAVISELQLYSTDKHLLQALINSDIDYTLSSSKGIREKIFKIFSTLERSEEQMQERLQ
ncbi:hypothetical protein [Legionella hackeliae]|uniref:Uncharacterized protein n=1 Tax=Legionella hackeliae TaxID=449 RepID=A0A0A8URG6_LEGHA|nr:hypothetical protein [Legionella hackeliae]KTD10153.1 hypothetical protein Lhac_2521 [Legionella hackeliae]CEK09647.1 protein of unknown function [Legionella hackeliae]STX49558.1 Uncharacterised protein [Legionella hackeliae]